jgi:hypothetical protein
MAASVSKVTVVDPTQDPSWDDRVGGLNGYSFFHSSAWARVLKESYGYPPLYLLSTAAGSVSGCLPVMEVNSWLTGRRGTSLPFTDECAPLAADSSSAGRLIEEAIRIGRTRGWRYFLSQGGGDVLERSKVAPPLYCGHLVNLGGTAQEVFNGFSEANRRAIRKAEREGVQVETAWSLEALRSYYSLHGLTRKRQGLPPQPWAFFAEVHRHAIAQQSGFVMLARFQGRVVAGAVFLHAGRHAVFKYGASDLAFQGLRANNLILWQAIQLLLAKGFSSLSLGRTSVRNDGLRRFKSGWGSSEHHVWYLRYDYGVEGFVPEQDGAYGWHNTVFRRLPRFVSRIAGAALYRHWSVPVAGLELLR